MKPMLINNNIIGGSGNTRLSRTGALTAHIDYLRVARGDMPVEAFSEFLRFLGVNYTVLMGHPWSPGAGAVYFDNKLIGTRGFIGGFSDNEDGSVRFIVQLPGEYWESLNLINSWRLLRGLKHCYQVRCTRIDLAIDDKSYELIPVDEMEEAWRNKQNFYFRNYKMILSGDDPDNLTLTHYFGSRNSGRLTRIYDHDGECMRHETEFKRGYSQPIFDEIALMEREDYQSYDVIIEEQEDVETNLFALAIQRRMMSHVVGAIDFRDRSGHKHKDKASAAHTSRLPFYQEYIDKLQASFARVKPTKEPRTLRKTIEWFRRQCAPTMSLIASAFDSMGEFRAWAGDLAEVSKVRMNQVHELWAEELRQKKYLLRIEAL